MRSRESCPNCGKYVRRLRGRRFFHCTRCGWVEGLPGLRWVTHYPRRVWQRKGYARRRYWRKTKRWGKRLVLLIVLIAVVGAFAGEWGPEDNLGPAGTSNGSTGTPAQNQVDTNTKALNETRVARLVHAEINERREARGLSPLNFDTGLQTIADAHSEHMVRAGFYNHTAPNGSDMGDRYDRHGYDCRVKGNDGQYWGGAENILYTYYGTDIDTKHGKRHYDTHQELAVGMVNSWMNSTGHRENILKPAWENEGIGVAVAEENGWTKVYATQNFC